MDPTITKQDPDTKDVTSQATGAPEEQTSEDAATAFYKRLTGRAGVRDILSRLANR